MILVLTVAVITFLTFSFLKSEKTAKIFNDFTTEFGKAVIIFHDNHLEEDEKIQQSQRIAKALIKKLSILAFWMLLLVIISISPFFIFEFNSTHFSPFEKIGYGGLGIVLGYASFLFVKKKRSVKHFYYSPSKKFFFYLTMGTPIVQRIFSYFQGCFFRNNANITEGIILTGLARSGTTALTKELSKLPGIKSFTYRHLPFLMAARFWSFLNFGKSADKERIHEDGIYVNLDSPDGFDEYFWRLILNESYYTPNFLEKHDLTESQIDKFEKFATQVLKPGETYLSKNNNFILRLKAFLDRTSKYKVLLVFREPVSQAESLLRQHLNLSKKQEEDPFIMHYMDWLGHHEFGLNLKDFDLYSRDFKFYNPETLNYWLERWINYYEYALKLNNDLIYFISNEQIRVFTKEFKTNLKHLKATNSFEFTENFDNSDLMNKAHLIFRNLKDKEVSIRKALSWN